MIYCESGACETPGTRVLQGPIENLIFKFRNCYSKYGQISILRKFLLQPICFRPKTTHRFLYSPQA
nr:MAG TPA: hypothetical protein [Caudoviricetes sp.]